MKSILFMTTAAGLSLAAFGALADSHVSAESTLTTETDLSADAGVTGGSLEGEVNTQMTAEGDASLPDGGEILPSGEPSTATADASDSNAAPMAETVVVGGVDGPVPVDVLIGADVHGPDGDDLGEISDIVFTAADGGTKALVDVGGFLGFGEHTVALDTADLTVTLEGDAAARVDVAYTRATLEEMPEYTAE